MGRRGRTQSASELLQQAIPARIVIGVTGHRKLENQPALTKAIRLAIQRINHMVPPLRGTPVVLTALSPLAEGADRLVAQEVLKMPGATLEVVLPFEKSVYMQEFETDESRQEFQELLSQARSARLLPSQGNRIEAYAQLGRYIVDQCDILIVLWNGESTEGRGGTADVVQYARGINCPLVWIHTNNSGQVTVERGRNLNLRPFQDLDEYNSERVNIANLEKQLKNQHDLLVDEAERAGLPYEMLRPTLEYTQRHYARTDLLALRYQYLFYRAESLVYVLALVAVVIATFQILFMPEQPMILISEIILMLAVLVIVGVNRSRRWHNKWIDYRFLAERFHSTLFMTLANVDVTTLRPPRHLSLAYSPKDWMVAAFLSFWSRRPRLKDADSSIFGNLRSFVCEAWIKGQIRYHDSTKRRHYGRHHRMAVASYILFGLTICAVLLHIADVGPDSLKTTFAFMAIVLPATAASITAIRTHRDYLRSSMRSAEMVRHLKELKDKMMLAQDYDSFRTLLRETEEAMLYENTDWRVMVRFHAPEVPV